MNAWPIPVPGVVWDRTTMKVADRIANSPLPQDHELLSGSSYQERGVTFWEQYFNNQLYNPLPCSPPATPPTATLAEPNAPSGEGGGTVRGACCSAMSSMGAYYAGQLEAVRQLSYGTGSRTLWSFCPWCGAKLGESEG